MSGAQVAWQGCECVVFDLAAAHEHHVGFKVLVLQIEEKKKVQTKQVKGLKLRKTRKDREAE